MSLSRKTSSDSLHRRICTQANGGDAENSAAYRSPRRTVIVGILPGQRQVGRKPRNTNPKRERGRYGHNFYLRLRFGLVWNVNLALSSYSGSQKPTPHPTCLPCPTLRSGKNYIPSSHISPTCPDGRCITSTREVGHRCSWSTATPPGPSTGATS